MTWHVGASGAWKQVTDAYVGVSGVWKRVTDGWVGAGGAWKKFHTSGLDAPENVAVTVLSTTALRVSWDAVTGATGYYVERSPNGTTGWTQVQDTASLTWDNTGLADGTEYFYRVIAHDAGTTESAPSAVDSAITTLKAPTLSGASATSGTSVTLTMTDGGSVAETEIRIEVATAGAAGPFQRASVLGFGGDPAPANSTSRAVTGLTPGEQYWFRLANYNAVYGESAYSSVQTATTIVPPGVPASVTAVDLGGGTARITWTQTSPDTETLYRLRIYSRSSPGGAWVLGSSFTNPANDLSVDRPIVEGFQYYWEVRAENAGGNSAYVASNSIEYVDTPGTPTSVALDYDGTNPESELVLSWAAPVSGGTFDGYDIEYVLFSGSFSGTPNDSSGVDTSERLTGLTSNLRWKARLRAKSSVWGTTGSWSAQADEYTAPVNPGTATWRPGWPKATADDTIELEVASSADEYEFHGGGATIATWQASENFAWTGRSANTQYTGLFVVPRNVPIAGSPHSIVTGTASTSQARYTLVGVPQGFSVSRDIGACPDNEFDAAWSNLNGDAVARSETMTLQRDDGSGYATVSSAVTAGATSYHDATAVLGTVAYRLRYNSEASYSTDTSLGPPCPE